MTRLEDFDRLTARLREYLECDHCSTCPYGVGEKSCNNFARDDLRELLKLFPILEVET